MSQKGNYTMSPVVKKGFEIIDAVFGSEYPCSVDKLAEMLNELGALHQGEMYWKQRCEAAEKYISESPFPNDISATQLSAYHHWKLIKDFQ